ncbi:uncharacterized protein LAESUDRAFT_721216 [Laetiporus sulphureus 93-53]|uniref:Chloride channel protein n=1 Tax=Laetiporus sulphureus 93-53 TaxID=1314785 RepID=A0A165GUF2_9APHY|nr:uncharacterized protein LAESUDRAFT_721216 [Laetiporus sulphureus 93-53]KZT10826.1 hypothetical protein LAESUDRAFT_721216 [Laetiporus sulphureus 93-53]
MRLGKSISNPALSSHTEEIPPGPLSGPSDPVWRRQRLLRIGNDVHEADETSALRADPPECATSYGTLPNLGHSERSKSKSTFTLRHGLRPLHGLRIPLHFKSRSTPGSPRSYFSIRDSYVPGQRPISAYDLLKDDIDSAEPIVDVKTNGIRVWYSSFTSIDWLHDVIKDSARQSHLRKHKSLRGRMLRQLDRGIGWIIVTIVGFLTAVIAFLIVRSEQWLFDLKEGYCHDDWKKAKRFCCAMEDDSIRSLHMPFLTYSAKGSCPSWRTWADIFGETLEEKGEWIGFEAEMVEYIAYAIIALTLAVVSSLLTIHLTTSTSFTTWKDSGVLSPEFTDPDEDQKVAQILTETEPKRKVMYYAAGSGIPEIKTILSGFVIHGYLGGRTLFTKAVGLALSVASGLSLGKEGPFVHIASCIGNIVSRFFSKYENNEGKRREILSAASAAGVAVAFGAPIGGVLFSLEEVSYFFPAKVMWRSFFCAMVAAMTLKFLDPFGSGKLVLLQVTYEKDWHAYELIFFLLLGVFGGVWGAYFSKLNYRWSKHVRSGTWLKTHPVAEVVLVTLATTVFCFLNVFTRMGTTELVYNLFAECRSGDPNAQLGLCVLDPPEQAMPVIRAILVALVVKGALTIVTFGIKLPAGIFIPSLAVGACAGRIVGILVQWLQYSNPDSTIFASCKGDLDCVIPGLYAMVGAAASLSGVTRTTVSLAVIMFELTDTLTYAVPVMLSVLVAKTVADALEPKGIYDVVIELSQLPYLDAKLNYVWDNHQIDDVMGREVDTICVDHENTVKSLRDQLQRLLVNGNSDSGFPILRNVGVKKRMVGYIGANELEHALSIVADNADERVFFHPNNTYTHGRRMTSSTSSLAETGSYMVDIDPFDFSPYMDKAPLTIQSNSPLELAQQFFTKLGARYVVVIDTDGYYEGVIDKKAWLAFLHELE